MPHISKKRFITGRDIYKPHTSFIGQAISTLTFVTMQKSYYWSWPTTATSGNIARNKKTTEEKLRADKEVIPKTLSWHCKGKEITHGKAFLLFCAFFYFRVIHTFDLSACFPYNKGEIKKGGREDMKTKRKYFYLDDFEHRLLVGCLMTARNEYLHDGKPMEDVDDLILKIIDAPSKKLRVIEEARV